MRQLRSTIAFLSALLWIAIINVWVRSYFDSETFFLMRGGRVLAVDCFGGEISFWRGEVPPTEDRWGHEHWERGKAITSIQQPIVNPMGADLWFAGFGYTTQRRFPLTYRTATYVVTSPCGVVIPFWFLALVAIIPPAFWTRRTWIQWQRDRIGKCPRCGYDLRASSDRCPECGTPINRQTATPRTSAAERAGQTPS